MRIQTRFFALLLLSCALPVQAGDGRVLSYARPDAAAMSGTAIEQAVALYRAAVARDDIRGAVLFAARHGKIVLHEAVGWRHLGYRLPMEKDTLFRMASNTKPVVATAALILVEEGRLGLEERVSKYFESFQNAKSRAITLYQLLTHTSGFRIRPILYPFEAKDGPPTLRAAVDKFGREGPEAEPGATYSYSNAGFNTAGALIEHAAGMPLEEFLKSRIYAPLGMTDTSNREDAAKLQRMATVYRGSRGADGRITFKAEYTPGDPPDFPVVRASGGMISTALDYAKFLQMYLDGGHYGGARILSAESIKKATSLLVKQGQGPKSPWYGLGWAVAESGVYSHGGSDGTMAWVDPARDLLVLAFTQSPGGKNPSAQFLELVQAACLER